MIGLENVLFFDIETIAAEDAIDFVGEISAPANWKDPEKIAAYVAEKQVAAVEKAALDPDIGEVAAISCLYFDKTQIGYEPNFETHTILDEGFYGPESDLVAYKSEGEIIHAFYDLWATCGKTYLCGYNIIDFDLPYIRRRAMANCIEPATIIRDRDSNLLDLMKVLFGWRGQAKSLKFLSDRYKLNNNAEGIDGSQVAGIVAAKDRDTLVSYVESDVIMVADLFKRMNMIYF